MGVVYLPIVFTNLPSPLNRPFTYLVLWCILIFLFHFKFYFHKNLLPVYLFILVYLVSIPIFWSHVTIGFSNHLNYIWLLKEISWTFLSILLCTYFISIKDYYGFGLVTLVALLFIAITSITSIIGLSLFPSATREMTSGEAAYAGTEIIFRNMGIGSYGFFSGIAFLFPPFAYFLKKPDLNLKLKLFLVFFILLSFYAIFKSGLTTSLFTALLFFIISFRFKGNKFSQKAFGSVIIILLIYILFKQQIAHLSYYLGDIFKDTTYEFKFQELGKLFQSGDFSPKSNQNYIAQERISRSYFSIMSFFENPIIGGGRSMGHAHWLDRLGMFGLVGVLPWILIFTSQIKQNLKKISETYKLFYYLSFISFIVFGLFKGGLESVETSVSIFFLVPGVFFLKYLVNNTKK